MRVAILGATGYSGTEAMRLLAARSDMEIVWVGSRSQAGQKVKNVLPQLRHSPAAELVFQASFDPQDFPAGIDAVLLGLPHGEALRIVPKLLEKNMRVIDFSGDFRLPATLYETWYKKPWDTAIAVSPVYGLPELYRTQIRDARLIANPGCYATAAELALLPLIEADAVDTKRLMVDAKSGVSGAGKNPQQTTHFVEVTESLRAYKVGAHQHTPEIEQVLHDARRRSQTQKLAATTDEAPAILMTTQLLPIRRGIYITAYAPLKNAASMQEIHELFAKRYASEPFVDVLPFGQIPEIRYVTGTNLCQIGIYVDPRTKTVLVMSAIDNLVKGAAGQAIQNLNIMFGLEETTGLPMEPWF